MRLATHMAGLLLLVACAPDAQVGQDDAAATDAHADAAKVHPDVKSDVDVADGVDGADGADGAEVAADVAETTPICGQSVNSDFGCPCEQDGDCDSGLCVETASGHVCTHTCSDVCPPDWVCKQTTGADSQWICLPGYPTLCMPCNADKDCQAGGFDASCLPRAHTEAAADGTPHEFIDGSFCSVKCKTVVDSAGAVTQTCPSGYHCQNAVPSTYGKAFAMCLPDAGECGCLSSWAQVGLSTGCTEISVNLICRGERRCEFDATGKPVLTACSAADPTSIFLDADGDGFGTGASLFICPASPTGYASKGGDCNDAAKAVHPGATEICNGIDDNCDGKTDEGFCDDGDGCTNDRCSDASAVCVHLPWGAMVCDDGNDCTKDLCASPAGSCSHGNVSGACDMTACSKGVCDGVGTCFVTAIAEGEICAPSTTCGVRTCKSGTCTPLTSVWRVPAENKFEIVLASGELFGGSVTWDGGEYNFGHAKLVVVDANGATVVAVDHVVQAGFGTSLSHPVVLSDGGAIAVGGVWPAPAGSNGDGSWVVRLTPAHTVVEWFTFPWNFTPEAIFPAPNNRFLAVGSGALPLTGSKTPAVSDNGCATLRNADLSEVWSVVLGNDATAWAYDGFTTAAKLPDGWLLAGHRRDPDTTQRPWLVWLSEDGSPTSEWIGPQSDAGFWLETIKPKGAGWLVSGSKTGTDPIYRFATADGTVVDLAGAATEVTPTTCLMPYACDTFVVGSTDPTGTKGSPTLLRIAPSGEWRWFVVWSLEAEYGWQGTKWVTPTTDNMLYVGVQGWIELNVGSDDCDFFCPPDIEDVSFPRIQHTDAFGNTTCDAAAGCAGRPMSDCDDKDPCTADGCKAGTCTHQPWPELTPCPGGTCQTGKCVAKP